VTHPIDWLTALSHVDLITERDEHRYSDIPGFDGDIIDVRPKALCLILEGTPTWFPISQLRQAGDGQSLYASKWILEQKGLG